MQESKWSRAEDEHRLMTLGPGHCLCVNRARQRLQEGGLLEWKFFRFSKRIARDDVRGQQQVVGISPRHHPANRLGTEVLLLAATVKADSARRGRRRHQSVAGLEGLDAGAGCGNYAGELVSEWGRQTKHRMATAIGFEVC